jgi:uncharacterized protein (TIGR03067 family)
MRRRFYALLALLVCLSAVAAPIPKVLKRDALQEIVGEWYEQEAKARMWWFKIDGTAGGGDLTKQEYSGRIRLDGSTEPKSIDWTSDNGQTWRCGIYKVEGNTLTILMNDKPTDSRPIAFEESKQTTLVTMTRR